MRTLLLSLCLLLHITLHARTVYVFDNTVFRGDVTGIEFTNAIQVGGVYEVFATNNWAPAASNYLGSIPSYAWADVTITNAIAGENLTPAPSVDIYVSTDGTTWTQDFTNVPVLLSVSTALTASDYAVSNLTIYAYANPSTVDAVMDARNQTILVDTPLADADPAQIANVQYVTARRAALWSGYPATSTVQLMSQLLDFGGGWRMQSSGTNWQFRVGGVPVMDASAVLGDASNIVLTNASSDGTEFEFTMLDAVGLLTTVETCPGDLNWVIVPETDMVRSTNDTDITITVAVDAPAGEPRLFRVAATAGESFGDVRFRVPVRFSSDTDFGDRAITNVTSISMTGSLTVGGSLDSQDGALFQLGVTAPDITATNTLTVGTNRVSDAGSRINGVGMTNGAIASSTFTNSGAASIGGATFTGTFGNLNISSGTLTVGAISMANALNATSSALTYNRPAAAITIIGTNANVSSGNLSMGGTISAGGNLTASNSIILPAADMPSVSGTSIALWNSNGVLFAVGASFTNQIAPPP
jgi:hypothetical protein